MLEFSKTSEGHMKVRSHADSLFCVCGAKLCVIFCTFAPGLLVQSRGKKKKKGKKRIKL